MMPDRHGGQMADRHMPRYCPYWRVCPRLQAERWAEAAKRILRIPVPGKGEPSA